MLIFPQLRSGAVAQLPLQRSENYRTLRNALPDGSAIQMADLSFAQVGWTLRFSDLTAAEVQALQTLFQSAEGRLNSFTFLDPSANLLCWSADLTQSVWSVDPQLALTGVQDAFGGAAGTQIANGAAAAQSIVQTINAPPSSQYCFSAYLRSDVAAQISLDVCGNAIVTVPVSGTWHRWEAIWTGGTGQEATFGLSIPPGTTIQVCGLQTEAQPAAGMYKSTTNIAGVHPKSRFDQDSIDITASGTGLFACNVRIVSPL